MGRNSRLKRERREARHKREREAETKRDQFYNLVVAPEALYAMRAAMLRSGMVTNSCIAATRCYVETCEKMGLNAFPMTVEGIAINPALWEWMQEKGGADSASDLREGDLLEARDRGGKMVVLGARDNPTPTKPGNWAGHLVAVVGKPGNYTVIDLSLDQASRPRKNLICEPGAFRVPDEWLDGGMTIRAHRPPEKGGAVVEYVAYPYDTSYEDAPDWNRTYNSMLTFNPKSGVQFRMDPVK